jgi:plastocyanin domain-containing protein
MINKTFLLVVFVNLGLLLGINSYQALAEITHKNDAVSQAEHQKQFQRVEQPIWLKGLVTASGLGLIGLELWWFLGSKPRQS